MTKLDMRRVLTRGLRQHQRQPPQERGRRSPQSDPYWMLMRRRAEFWDKTRTEMDIVQAVYRHVLIQIPDMALSTASPPLSSMMSRVDVVHANGRVPNGETEVGALDLYDAQGWFMDRIIFSGDREALFLDLRHLMPRLLASPCKCLILRHRHPSGLAVPSQADIATTRSFADILRLIGIELHDHLIEGAGRQYSFRAEGLL